MSSICEIHFQKATTENAADVVALVNSAYRGESAKKGWTYESDLLDDERITASSLLETLRDPQARIELAYSSVQSLGQTLVGCVVLNQESSTTCYFGMLTVLPTLQDRGIGKQLLLRSEQIAQEWGCQFLRAAVIHVREELLQFYVRNGFSLSGKSEDFYCRGRDGQELKMVEIIKTVRKLTAFS